MLFSAFLTYGRRLVLAEVNQLFMAKKKSKTFADDIGVVLLGLVCAVLIIQERLIQLLSAEWLQPFLNG